MTQEERYKKYIKENCKNCKNKTTDICEIRILQIEDTIITKCENYERDKETKPRKKAIQYWQKW